MSSYKIKRIAALPTLALAAVALALPLASQAASGSGNAKTEPGPPILSLATVRVSGTTAVLSGSVDPRTYATTYYFEYGASSTSLQPTPSVTIEAGKTETVRVSQTVTGFLANYHYRLVAKSNGITRETKERVYTVKTTKKKTEFVLPKTFQPIPLGGTFVISGTLTGTGSANRAIVLQATPYPYTAPYADIGTQLLTGPAGAFSFRVANLLSATKFRVETVGPLPVLSRVVPAQVTVRVVLKARSSGHKGLVRLYGTVTPAEVGAKVFIELEKVAKPKAEKPGKLEKPEKPGRAEKEKGEKPPSFSTKFDTVVKRATKAISRFSVVVSVRDTGRYRAFVQVQPGAVGSGASTTVTLHAASTKAKKKKKG
jgi:hypothetical protein